MLLKIFNWLKKSNDYYFMTRERREFQWSVSMNSFTGTAAPIHFHIAWGSFFTTQQS